MKRLMRRLVAGPREHAFRALDGGAADHPPETSARRTASDDLLDDVARALGNPMPRRTALGVALTGIASAALAQLGVKTAWAAPNCLCQGQVFNPDTACCTPTGVQPKHPIANLNACPNRVPHPGYTCVANGCGAAGGQQFPGGFGQANFVPCCNGHDCCWGTCNNNRGGCDNTFHACLVAACQAAYPGTGVLDGIRRGSCNAAANAYFQAVSSRFGNDAYDAAQRGACDCCPAEPCPQTCAGGTCSSLPSCEDPGCVCFQTVEGTGFCHRPQACAGLATCSSSANCPAGWACVSVTCCGPQSICIQPCFVIGPGAARAEMEVTGQTTVGYR